MMSPAWWAVPAFCVGVWAGASCIILVLRIQKRRDREFDAEHKRIREAIECGARMWK